MTEDEQVIIEREVGFGSRDLVYVTHIGGNVYGITRDRAQATLFLAVGARRLLKMGRWHGLNPRLLNPVVQQASD